MHGKCGVLQVLLKEGVELGVVDRRQWCAVHHAAFHGRLGILQVNYHGRPDSLGGTWWTGTVEPLLMDPPRSGLPLNNGQISGME